MPVPVRSLNVWASVIQVASAWVVSERVETILELGSNSGSEYEDDASGKFTDPFRTIEHQKSQGVRLKEVWVPGSVTVFGCSYYTNSFLFASPHSSTLSWVRLPNYGGCQIFGINLWRDVENDRQGFQKEHYNHSSVSPWCLPHPVSPLPNGDGRCDKSWLWRRMKITNLTKTCGVIFIQLHYAIITYNFEAL